MKLRCGDRLLPLDRTVIMGVLNVTPDSFSDGGLWVEAGAATRHAVAMVEQGAGILDVGGESTRPGAQPVAEDEELERVLPVIEALSGIVEVPISIDTRKASVARRAVAAGASIVNDTGGERSDRALDEVASDSGAAIVVMHSRGTPATMRSLTEYDDVVDDVAGWLGTRAGELEAGGLPSDAIVLDPGFGFAKTPEQNLELLRRLDEVVGLGFPVVAGTSRKSFIGDILGLPVHERIEGTAATVSWAVARGAHIVRVHDVEPIARVVKMIDAIRGAQAVAS
ncbi:dihydropteroate synthase [soil metagenome]